MRDQKAWWTRRTVIVLGTCVALLGTAVQGRGQEPAGIDVGGTSNAALDDLLDRTFRIDIDTIIATLDWYPATGTVDGTATMTFRMRPGQTRAVFQFTPFATARSAVSRLVLDGRAFNPQSDSDVRLVTVTGTRQTFVEIAFALDPAAPHTLTLDYRLTVPAVYPRFSSEVNDVRGAGNEVVWPTLNTPHELARHHLTFRVHDVQPFRFVGSGRAAFRRDGNVQEWTLDTQRAVSSYTVMFVLLPAADTSFQEWLIDDVPVRALAYSTVDLANVKTILDAWLPELRRRFGPFPALHGLSLFLFNTSGGGMEYYGGTVTSVSALRHEVLHSYFGCSVVARTYADSWLDEAVTTWFENIERGVRYPSISAGYRGNWVGARSPVSVGFSTLAYSDGASMMQTLAERLGGTDRMTDFLRSVVNGRTFAPFGTLDFAGDYVAFSGIDVRPQFLTWLYNGHEPATLFQGGAGLDHADKDLDLSPPWLRRSVQ